MSQEQLTTEDPTVAEAAARVVGEQPATAHGELSIEEDLLVEEVSIDGMCGVY